MSGRGWQANRPESALIQNPRFYRTTLPTLLGLQQVLVYSERRIDGEFPSSCLSINGRTALLNQEVRLETSRDRDPVAKRRGIARSILRLKIGSLHLQPDDSKMD